jgi:hypothetical protein
MGVAMNGTLSTNIASPAKVTFGLLFRTGCLREFMSVHLVLQDLLIDRESFGSSD